jgi:hypothetical protein
VQYFGNLSAQPGVDSDGDGATNGDEMLAGTNPTQAASVFRLLSATVTGSDLQLSWSAVGGRSYLVQAQVSLAGVLAGAFTNLSPVITAVGSGETNLSYPIPGGLTNGAGFYRVRLQP